MEPLPEIWAGQWIDAIVLDVLLMMAVIVGVDLALFEAGLGTARGEHHYRLGVRSFLFPISASMTAPVDGLSAMS